MLGYPVKFEGGDLPAPGPAPSAGQHSEEVLREVAGYDEERIQKMREAGVLG
jgi:CoA:oxalate CoA-transferase